MKQGDRAVYASHGVDETVVVDEVLDDGQVAVRWEDDTRTFVVPAKSLNVTARANGNALDLEISLEQVYDRFASLARQLSEISDLARDGRDAADAAKGSRGLRKADLDKFADRTMRLAAGIQTAVQWSDLAHTAVTKVFDHPQAKELLRDHAALCQSRITGNGPQHCNCKEA